MRKVPLFRGTRVVSLPDGCPMFWDSVVVSSSRTQFPMKKQWTWNPWRLNHYNVSERRKSITQRRGVISKKDANLTGLAAEVQKSRTLWGRSLPSETLLSPNKDLKLSWLLHAVIFSQCQPCECEFMSKVSEAVSTSVMWDCLRTLGMKAILTRLKA
jgi:hypothetical protein